ncbi:MAG: hypothetical protein ORN26_01965, partial [Candidatus Pacebacteria bacterium]|nr:hypothetical protein [Candidatus Paceibacterota bacterium]
TTPTTTQLIKIQPINKIIQNDIKPKSQPKVNIENIDSNKDNVDKSSIPFYKKLLYFLYE